jgi:hypothetical protein
VLAQAAGDKKVTFMSQPEDQAGQVYSDPPMAVWDWATQTAVPALPSAQVPNLFLRAGPSFDQLREARSHPCAAHLKPLPAAVRGSLRRPRCRNRRCMSEHSWRTVRWEAAEAAAAMTEHPSV